MAWLPATSVVVEPARAAITRWADGGIILSSVVTRYQLDLVRQAGSVIAPPRASTPQGTCESAMQTPTTYPGSARLALELKASEPERCDAQWLSAGPRVRQRWVTPLLAGSRASTYGQRADRRPE